VIAVTHTERGRMTGIFRQRLTRDLP